MTPILEKARLLRYIPGLKPLLLPIYTWYANKRRNYLYRKNGLKVLYEFDKIMNDNNIHYAVFAGTLLGAIREKGFLRHDMDIDTVMFYRNYSPIIQNLLEANGFKLLHTFLIDDGRTGREDTFIKNGVTVDIYYIYSDDKCSTYQCDFHGANGAPDNEQSMKIYGYTAVRRIEFPVSEKVRRVQFENIEVNVPANAEEWLSLRYGSDYMTPNPNFKDKGDNPHIIEWSGKKAIMLMYQ